MNIRAIALGFGIAIGAKPALAVEGARLQVFNATPTNADLTYEDFAGPITIRQANRSGSIQATADYGAVRTASTQRITSRDDTRSTDIAVASTRWDDTFTLTLQGAGTADIGFWIDVKVPTPKQTTKGFRSATGRTEAIWGIQFQEFTQFGDVFDLATGTALGSRETTDTPLRAPTTVASFSALSENLNPNNANVFDTRISSVASTRAGFERYLVTATFGSGREYTLLGATTCFTELTAFRIGDSASGSCGVTILEWGGVAGIFNIQTGAPIPTASVSFDSVSGYDYNEPFSFEAPVVAGLRSAGIGAAAAIPEPASWAMLIGGLGLTGGFARRQRAVAG